MYYRLLCADPEAKEKADAIREAMRSRYTPERLSPDAARLLYGEQLYGSVTRIENYEKCPYAHFLKYGLQLKEREEFEIAALDIGNLYHNALNRVFREAKRMGTSIDRMSREETAELVRKEAAAEAAEYENGRFAMDTFGRYIADRAADMTETTVEVLREHLGKGTFETRETEHSFRIEGENLHLHGKIDRLDISETEDRIFVKVIDYKSGSMRFDLALAEQGISLQLVTYLRSAVEELRTTSPEKEIVPAGMFYYSISDPALEAEEMGGKDLEAELRKKHRMDGLVVNDPEAIERIDQSFADGAKTQSEVIFYGGTSAAGDRWSKVIEREDLEALMESTALRLEADGKEILEGDIRVHPFKDKQRPQCANCSYHSICGFDTRIEGYTYRYRE